jgi:DNA polymerase-3 subunit gamma/tau
VRYRPVSARHKVYIIDEVHMLSRQAFNGLLKTLEEPPEHVIFVFATTEIRKVPVTVLSRCQRFDLRRVSQAELLRHFAGIAEKEGVAASEAALGLIARAADGSVRDGLSLLDQAMALSASGAAGEAVRIEEDAVKEMLGLADRARIFDLFEAVAGGRAPEALDILSEMYRAGADPAVVLQDLLELTHFLTRSKLVPEQSDTQGLPETERVRGRKLAGQLSLPVLARFWQMLLKGLGETRGALAPLQAAEMVLIRLTYASELPTPGDLVKRLTAETAAAADSGAAGVAGAPAPAAAGSGGPRAAASGAPSGGGGAALARDLEPAPVPQAEAPPEPAGPEALGQEALGVAPAQPASFEEVVELVVAEREAILARHLTDDVHLVHFEPGRIELRPTGEAPRDLAGKLGRLLQERTGRRWLVSVSGEPGQPTLRRQRDAAEAKLRDAALRDPLVQAVLETFPGAKLVARRGKADKGDDSA